MKIELDRSEWPLIIVRWPGGTLSDELIEDYLQQSESDLARREVHCILHDARGSMGLSAQQRKRFADHLQRHHGSIAEWSAGVAIATPSALIRGMITAVNWIIGTPCPQKQFATAVEARAWLAEMYQQKTGQRAPFDPRALRAS